MPALPVLTQSLALVILPRALQRARHAPSVISATIQLLFLKLVCQEPTLLPLVQHHVQPVPLVLTRSSLRRSATPHLVVTNWLAHPACPECALPVLTVAPVHHHVLPLRLIRTRQLAPKQLVSALGVSTALRRETVVPSL